MQKIKLLILSCCLWLGSDSVGGGITADEIDTYLMKMFDYAKRHDVQALEQFKNEVQPTPNRTLNHGYSLALYMASPDNFKQQYVENFPVDYEGIMYDLYERIELKRLTPKFLYSMEEVGKIAEEGNEQAIEKVLRGVGHSDGVVSELFCDFELQLLNKQLPKTVKVLSRLNKEERFKSYLCFKQMDSTASLSLKKHVKILKPNASKSEKLVIKEIESYQ